MANNLHRVLTSYVAIPAIVDDPAAPKSGDACRVGRNVGVALVNEQFGYASGGYRELEGFQVNKPYDPINLNDYSDGQTPVSLQHNQWKLPVFNSGNAGAGAVGAIVYYYDTLDGPAGDVNYHLVVGATTAADAVAGVLRSAIGGAGVDGAAIVEIMPSPVHEDALTP